MKKLLRNSLIASVVAVAGAAGFAGEAKAQSVDVDFSTEVPNTCTITKDSNGTLEVSGTVMDANNDRAAIKVNCAASGSVTVTDPTPTTQAATDYTSQSGIQTVAELWSSATGGSYLADSQGMFGQTSYTAESNGSDVPIYVNMFSRGQAIPTGDYGFTTTVTVNPL